MNHEDRDLAEIADRLKRLRPSRADVDANVLFYNAGYTACKSELGARRRIRIAPLVAASLLAVIVAASISYRAGRTSALRADPVRHDAVAEAETAPAPPALDEQSDSGEWSRGRPESKLLARWIDPYRALTESANVGKSRGTTLAAFHASLVSQPLVDLVADDFPVASSRSAVDDLTAAVNRAPSSLASPLAANDLSQFVQSFEAVR